MIVAHRAACVGARPTFMLPKQCIWRRGAGDSLRLPGSLHPGWTIVPLTSPQHRSPLPVLPRPLSNKPRCHSSCKTSEHSDEAQFNFFYIILRQFWWHSHSVFAQKVQVTRADNTAYRVLLVTSRNSAVSSLHISRHQLEQMLIMAWGVSNTKKKGKERKKMRGCFGVNAGSE